LPEIASILPMLFANRFTAKPLPNEKDVSVDTGANATVAGFNG
jgi:hypothetical protein